MVLEKIVSLIESIEVDEQKRKISQSELKRSQNASEDPHLLHL